MQAKIQARVHARASRNEIEGGDGSAIRVYVTAPPEGGKANDAVVAPLADRLGIPKRDIGILRGRKGRDKVLLVDGLNADAVRERLFARTRRPAVEE